MSNFNQKGPEEKGPKTGRGLGKCNKEKTISEEWYDKLENGEGYHFGRGRGRRNGNGFGRGCGRGLNQVGGRGRGRGRNENCDS
jgi:hypothetical protein